MPQFNWTPGIGDPSIRGWVTVVLYLACAFVCWRTARKLSEQAPNRTEELRIWWCVSVLFTVLGINKQLDLQTALTELGRIIAQHQGWYAHRQTVQLAFIVVHCIDERALGNHVDWLGPQFNTSHLDRIDRHHDGNWLCIGARGILLPRGHICRHTRTRMALELDCGNWRDRARSCRQLLAITPHEPPHHTQCHSRKLTPPFSSSTSVSRPPTTLEMLQA